MPGTKKPSRKKASRAKSQSRQERLRAGLQQMQDDMRMYMRAMEAHERMRNAIREVFPDAIFSDEFEERAAQDPEFAAALARHRGEDEPQARGEPERDTDAAGFDREQALGSILDSLERAGFDTSGVYHPFRDGKRAGGRVESHAGRSVGNSAGSVGADPKSMLHSVGLDIPNLAPEPATSLTPLGPRVGFNRPAPKDESVVRDYSNQHLEHLPQLIMFDLDGTLAHTLPQLTLALCQMAQELDLHVPTPHEVGLYVGNGMDLLLARTILGRSDATVAAVDPALLAWARKSFVRHYGAGLKHNFELYPDVLAGLKAFHEAGIKLAVVSNKPDQFVQPLMEYMGLKPYIDLALGGGKLAHKPDPEPLNYVLTHFKVKPEQALMVGDSNNDIRAGKNAGVPTVALTYGYNGGQDLRKEEPEFLFDHFKDFSACVLAAAHD
ncbi:MAG TPA: HAD-IIIA family hydrolase [Candidatus Anaerobiospirillum stercoravium]|nr:HAD-IIIA family hydrolase [Candidatus Anaerobiospirillum stercoravium]